MLGPWLTMTVLLAALLTLHHRGWLRAEWVVKPLAALTFVVYGARSGAFESTFGRVLFAGLVLAALGDVLLIPKDRRAFLAGLVAFLLGHLAYAAAFVVRGVDVGVAVGALAVFALVGAPVVRWLWPSVEAPMRGPVAAYVAVITAMVALSAGAAWQHGLPLLFVGALAFYCSDLAVARDQFVKREFLNRAWGMPVYFYAQMILASQAGAG